MSKKYLKKFVKITKKYWRLITVFFLALIFFLGTASFNYYTQSYGADDDFVKWASPDETANYTFTKLYAQEHRISFNEDYNLMVSDIIHPRSFRSDYGEIKPVSFLGIILIFGKIASVTSYKIIPFLTPLFASLAIIYYYLLVKKIFGRRNALFSALLLAIFPPFIYYSSRSMFHNVLFISLLVSGLYYAVMMTKNKMNKTTDILFEKILFYLKRFLYPSLAGLLIGLAIITRTSELIWILPSLLILWLFNIKRVGIFNLVFFISFLIVSLLPVFYYNSILYGSFYQGGYAEMNKSIINLKETSADIIKSASQGSFKADNNLFDKISKNIFFFGINPKQTARVFYNYFINMFPWIFWLAAAGFLVFLARWKKQKYGQWVFIIAYVILSGILVIYYGSWDFHDNPDANSITIGNSYTRYWLPIYLGAIPFASLLVLRVTKVFSEIFSIKNSKLKNNNFLSIHISRKVFCQILRLLIYLAILISSLYYVLNGSSEGLIYLAQRQKDSKIEYDKVLDNTEKNSVIITRYHDKLFFPARKVIVGLFDDSNMTREYAKLADLLPVYYYNFTFPEKDLNYLNTRKLRENNLNLKPIEKVTKDFTLYKLEKVYSLPFSASSSIDKK